MDRAQVRKNLFQNLKKFCIDSNALETKDVVEVVERYQKTSILNERALNLWQNLIDVIGIDIKF